VQHGGAVVPFASGDTLAGVKDSLAHKEPFVVTTAILAAALAACYVCVPWHLLAGQGFADRANYLADIDALASSGEQPLDFSGGDVLALWLNEYLWRQLLVIIGTYFQDPGDGLLVLSWVATLLVTSQIIRKAGVGYAVVFLCAPLSIDLFMSQTRSALAVSLFMWGLSIRRLLPKHLLFVLAFLIHSFGAVLFLMYCANALVLARDNIGLRGKLFFALLLGAIGAAVWSFLAQDIFTAIGDRRAEQEAILSASFAFAGWWALLTCALVSSARIIPGDPTAQFIMTAVCLQSMFIFTTLFGAGGVRFLSLSLPFVFVAIRSMQDSVLRASAVVGTIAFNVFHAYLWTAQP
jgi:hypothetical protein